MKVIRTMLHDVIVVISPQAEDFFFIIFAWNFDCLFLILGNEKTYFVFVLKFLARAFNN